MNSSVHRAIQEFGREIMCKKERVDFRPAEPVEGKNRNNCAVISVFGESCPIANFVRNGTTCKILVDTGSRITLLNEKVLDLLTRRGERQVLEAREPHKVRFVGITAPDLGTGGLYLSRLTSRNFSFDHSCYICSDAVSLPEEVSGLAGQDLLRKHGFDLILNENCLPCSGELVPLANQEAEYAA